MEQRALPEVEQYRYFDPKLLRPPAADAAAVRSRVAFQEAIVFVVGGGNYIEYQNLVDYTKVLRWFMFWLLYTGRGLG